MALLNKLMSLMAVLMVAILFAIVLDVGHLGLKNMGMIYQIIPIGLMVTFAIVPIFLGSKKGATVAGGDPEAISKIEDTLSKTKSRLTSLQSTIDGLSGQDNETLLEENRQLKEQLEAIQNAEKEQVLADSEMLRAKNKELEDQIKQWAIQTVGSTVTGGEEAA